MKIDRARAGGDAEHAEKLRLELAEELEAVEEEMKGYRSWEEFMITWNEHLSQCLSPLRTADIGDMIVERDSRYLEEDAASLAQAVRSLKKGAFTLLTEDEWEYLCNGGARTLFRWGVTRRFIVIRFMNMKVYCQRVITVIAGLSGFRDRDPFAGAWKHSDCKVTGLEVQQCPEELGSVTRILKN